MVAYSFKRRFAEPIQAGLEPGPLVTGMKRQTIRAHRKRHARPGETVQLYTGMRTRHCLLLGVGVCAAVVPIRLILRPPYALIVDGIVRHQGTDAETLMGLDGFARLDGFPDGWEEMRAFWAASHPLTTAFDGVLIRWNPRSEA